MSTPLPTGSATPFAGRANLALATTAELEAECAKRGLDVRDPFAFRPNPDRPKRAGA